MGSLSALTIYPIDNKTLSSNGFGWARPPHRTPIHASLPIPSLRVSTIVLHWGVPSKVQNVQNPKSAELIVSRLLTCFGLRVCQWGLQFQNPKSNADYGKKTSKRRSASRVQNPHGGLASIRNRQKVNESLIHWRESAAQNPATVACTRSVYTIIGYLSRLDFNKKSLQNR